MNKPEKPPKPRGRPPVGKAATGPTLRLRVTDEQEAAYKSAAGEEGFSAWARRHLDRIAARALKSRDE